MRVRIVRLCSLFALLLAACDPVGTPETYGPPRDVIGPVALGTQVAFVERAYPTAFLIDPADPALRPRLVALAKDPAVVVRRAGQDELLVLSRGERGDTGLPPLPAELAVIPADAKQPARVVKLASRFNALDQSIDGRIAIAHFTKDSKRAEALFNPNEIAIIDLGSMTVVPRTIRSFGSLPLAVVFSPRMTLGQSERSVAVILSDNYITVLDLDHLDRSEITVPLTLPNDKRTVLPRQVLFDAKKATIYVRADAANDVYALRLEPALIMGATDNDFHLALTLLAAGTRPSDMARYDSIDGSRLVVTAAGSNDVFVIDVDSSLTTRIPLGISADHVTLFDAVAPGDAKVRTRALIVGTAAESPQIAFLNLDHVEQQGARNLGTLSLGAGAVGLQVLPDRNQAVVLHRSVAGAPGMTVVDLAHQTAAPIFAEAPVSGVTRGAPGSEMLWIAAMNSNRLGFLGLTNLTAGEVRLDAVVQGVVVLAKSNDGHSRVVAIHQGEGGDITVLDADKPERATARHATGFLLTDLLDRGAR